MREKNAEKSAYFARINKLCLHIWRLMMQTGSIVVFLIIPVLLDGCCVGRKSTETGCHKTTEGTTLNYRAVEGDLFRMPCIDQNTKVVWSRTGDGTGGEENNMEFRAEEKHSGTYTCLNCGSNVSFNLQVEKNRCFQPEESIKYLVISAGGDLDCPGHNCSDNTNVVWYKGIKPMSKRDHCVMTNGSLHLCQVKDVDADVFFCDRQVIEQGVKWILRRSVNVKVVPYSTLRDPPHILYPKDNAKEKVELGRPHNLTCEVSFPFERQFSPEVQWYMNYGGNTKNMTLEVPEQKEVEPFGYKVTLRAIIKEVTPEHLSNTYTCIARNTIGNDSVTIKLEEKVKWPSLVGYPVASLLLMAGLGIVIHAKWLELQLIYRSHFTYGKHDGDEKEFDVFLSYVWSPASAEVGEDVTLSSRSGPDNDEASNMDPQNSEEGGASLTPPELLLPKVVEDQWGYRLCLLERDVLPGGAYTNDVVLAIQRSRMLICLLSAEYLSNSNAVFVLESGVQALLQNSGLKLLLIWTSTASASLVQLDPPLPILVKRALRVLPSLDWTPQKSTRITSNFWRSLRKAMPDHRVKLVHPSRTNYVPSSIFS